MVINTDMSPEMAFLTIKQAVWFAAKFTRKQRSRYFKFYVFELNGIYFLSTYLDAAGWLHCRFYDNKLELISFLAKAEKKLLSK